MMKKTLVIAATAATLGLAALPSQARDDRAAGALVGAGLGALIGSSVNGGDGAVIGGVLGAITGAAIADNGYDRHGRYDRYDHRYRDSRYGRAPSYVYGRPAYVQRYPSGYTRAYNRGYARDHRDYRRW